MADQKIRLLICQTCESIEELPDYDGSPDNDDTLNHRVSFHRFADGREHMGVLAKVPAESWENPQHRTEIVNKIAVESGKPGTGVGLGETFYDVKANYNEDAFECWKRHGKTHNCSEFRADHKRLYPDTKAERKELGLSPKRRPNTFLCDFCPMSAIVAQRQKSEKYGYNYNG